MGKRKLECGHSASGPHGETHTVVAAGEHEDGSKFVELTIGDFTADMAPDVARSIAAAMWNAAAAADAENVTQASGNVPSFDGPVSSIRGRG